MIKTNIYWLTNPDAEFRELPVSSAAWLLSQSLDAKYYRLIYLTSYCMCLSQLFEPIWMINWAWILTVFLGLAVICVLSLYLSISISLSLSVSLSSTHYFSLSSLYVCLSLFLSVSSLYFCLFLSVYMILTLSLSLSTNRTKENWK